MALRSMCKGQVLILVLLVLISSPAAGQDSQENAGSKSEQSFFSLFNMGNSSFWDENLLVRTLDELQRGRQSFRWGAKEAEAYQQAGNLAAYMGLEDVDNIALTLPVNFIFVGFTGDGNLGLELKEAELKHWFQHIDLVVQHTRVPRSGHGPKNVRPEPRHEGKDLPLLSYVHYNFSAHAINLSPRASALFEKVLYTVARKDGPSSQESEGKEWYQVDADFVSSFAAVFLDHLKLSKAYNVFVLNPKKAALPGPYGFRIGLSPADLQVLRENEERTKKLLADVGNAGPSEVFGKVKGLENLRPERPSGQFLWHAVRESDDEAWVKAFEDAVFAEEEELQSGNVHGLSDVDALYKRMEYTLRKGSWNAALYLRKVLEKGGRNAHADALVDVWIGNGRFAWIDLTAGPFTYGPVVGGEGLRTDGSVPNVEAIFGHVTEAGSVPDKSDEELEEELRTIAAGRFTKANSDPTSLTADMLLAELDVYEMFARTYCKGRKRKIALCDSLSERMSDMHTELWKFHPTTDDPDKRQELVKAAARIRHRSPLFESEIGREEPYVPGSPSPMSRARDNFLARLGALLSGTLRHVVAPSTAEGYYPFHEKVVIQLYLVSQGGSADDFPFMALRNELLDLRLPNQIFQFSGTSVQLGDDPALAMAFSEAIHTAVVPTLKANGTREASKRVYLDSAQLQAQLQHQMHDGRGVLRAIEEMYRLESIFDTSNRVVESHHKDKHSRGVLEVPVFVFQTDEPVFLDQHHTARALPDMVIATMCKEQQWESHLQANGQPTHWDLSNPLKTLMASITQHLAGVLPTHVGYSIAHGAVEKNWLWSVGANPFSATSHGWSVSKLHVDTAHRSHVITALDASAEHINMGIHLLTQERNHIDTFGALRRLPLTQLMVTYGHVITLWMQIVASVEELEYGIATSHIARLDQQAEKFYELAQSIHKQLHPIRCTKRRRVNIGIVPTAGGAACLALVFLLVKMARPKKLKPKIN